jgi:hypothetical protein
MPIIGSTEVKQQTAYDVQNWLCCIRLVEKRQVPVNLLGVKRRRLAEKKQVRLHLLGVKRRIVVSSHPISAHEPASSLQV